MNLLLPAPVPQTFLGPCQDLLPERTGLLQTLGTVAQEMVPLAILAGAVLRMPLVRLAFDAFLLAAARGPGPYHAILTHVSWESPAHLSIDEQLGASPHVPGRVGGTLAGVTHHPALLVPASSACPARASTSSLPSSPWGRFTSRGGSLWLQGDRPEP